MCKKERLERQRGDTIMDKIYRINVKKASKDNQREFLWETFTSRKKAQELCDKINALDPSREAVVVVK